MSEEEAKQEELKQDNDSISKREVILSRTESYIKKIFSLFLSKKALPAYLVFGALYVSSFRRPNPLFNNGKLNVQILTSQLNTIIDLLNNSLLVGSTIRASTTAMLIGAIWTAYIYWLRDSKYLEKVRGLMKRIVLALTVAIILFRHVSQSSPVAQYSGLIVLIIAVYLELAGTWFLAKLIDHIDLSSDLKNWTLKLIGLPTVLIGAVSALGTSPVISLSLKTSISGLIFLGSILVMMLGGFMIYRSTRREPALKVW